MAHRCLKGKTVFITGASRGIGRSVALRLAKEKCNIAICAKTSEKHPKLEGTIHTVAEEVEKSGGKALACIVDVRSEEDVMNAVDKTIKSFGGIDILVNNASAIYLSNTRDLTMKQYDLMHNINTRGTYLCSKVCFPHLSKASNPHIVNMSPPLSMNPIWFKNFVGYTMAKYGMSMCVLGMTEEFKSSGVAVNALWPRTAIATDAIRRIAGDTDDILNKCRTPDILADALYHIVTSDSRSVTGNFFIDEEVLAQNGVKDLDKYSCKPGTKDFMMDFYLKEAEVIFNNKTTKSHFESSKTSYNLNDPRGIIDSVDAFLKKSMVPLTKGNYLINLNDPKSQWFIDSNGNGGGRCGSVKDDLNAQPLISISMQSKDFVDFANGRNDPSALFISGRMKIDGDFGALTKMMLVFKKIIKDINNNQ